MVQMVHRMERGSAGGNVIFTEKDEKNEKRKDVKRVGQKEKKKNQTGKIRK